MTECWKLCKAPTRWAGQSAVGARWSMPPVFDHDLAAATDRINKQKAHSASVCGFLPMELKLWLLTDSGCTCSLSPVVTIFSIRSHSRSYSLSVFVYLQHACREDIIFWVPVQDVWWVKDSTYVLIAVWASQLWLFRTRMAAFRSIWVKLMNWLMAAFCCAV